uniref:Uncharacterized protein n=1 Tax=Arundo donax TaxID=35708 RepID=A0A0A9H1R6_ARUDO
MLGSCIVYVMNCAIKISSHSSGLKIQDGAYSKVGYVLAAVINVMMR